MDKNLEKSTNEELSIPEKEMSDYKQIFEKESLQKKRQYLQAIKEHNQVLVAKIKEFDEKVNSQVNALTKKIVPKKKATIHKFEEIQTKPLKQKFEELQKYKRQLDIKRSGTDSLEFLLTVKKKLEIKLNQLNKELFNKKKEIHQLKKIKEKSLKSDQIEKNQVNKIGDLDIYSNDIQQLRMRVREKSDNLRAKKDEFLSLYKQNKSNKSIILQSPSKEQQAVKQSDPQLIKLKQQYENLGKKVQILKLKKSNLTNQIKGDAQHLKKLQKLKSKYELLSKAST